MALFGGQPVVRHHGQQDNTPGFRYNSESMDVDRLIGTKLAVGLPGPDVTPAILDALRHTRAQSLVVFSRNFTSVAQWTRLLKTLREALGYELLVMVDHEGGRVIRFSEGVTRFPDSLTAGKTQ